MGTKSTKSVGELLTLFTASIFPNLGYKVDDVENDIFYAEKEEEGRFLWVMLKRDEEGKMLVSFMFLFVPMDDDPDPQKHFDITLDVSDDVEGLGGWRNETDGRLMVTYDLTEDDCTEELILNHLEAFFKVINDFCANYILTVAMDEIFDEESE